MSGRECTSGTPQTKGIGSRMPGPGRQPRTIPQSRARDVGSGACTPAVCDVSRAATPLPARLAGGRDPQLAVSPGTLPPVCPARAISRGAHGGSEGVVDGSCGSRAPATQGRRGQAVSLSGPGHSSPRETLQPRTPCSLGSRVRGVCCPESSAGLDPWGASQAEYRPLADHREAIRTDPAYVAL